MHSECTPEINRSPKPTATHIYHSQQIQENYSPLRLTPQNGIFGGGGGVGFGEIPYVKAGHAIPHLKGLCTHTVLVTRVFNCCHPTICLGYTKA